MKRLYYIRHGLSEMNVASVFAGRTDTPLTTEGQQEALQEGRANIGIAIDLIIASPLSRAHDTAKLFAEGAQLPTELIELNELLLERDFGILEGSPWSPANSQGLDTNQPLPKGVEPWDVLRSRAQQLIDHIQRLPVDNILLVGHGSIGRAIRNIIDPKADIHAHIPNSKLIRWI
ncbi:phosphoglycerate mutase family protein [Candidatus Saccharibacteria bacterium]|nr:phosphoglycerate mutase family protein [Candidatus Saccharibacteria bacterium]